MTIDQAISRLDNYLDKVSKEAEEFMKDYIETNANKGYATGALKASINTLTVSPTSRSVGSSLRSKSSGKVYGHFVDKGRGEIRGKYMKYYDTKAGKWITTTHVSAMDGIDFIDATRKHIQSKKIPL